MGNITSKPDRFTPEEWKQVLERFRDRPTLIKTQTDMGGCFRRMGGVREEFKRTSITREFR